MNWQDWAALGIVIAAAAYLIAPWVKRWRSPDSAVAGCGRCSNCPVSTAGSIATVGGSPASAPVEVLSIAPLSRRKRPSSPLTERNGKTVDKVAKCD